MEEEHQWKKGKEEIEKQMEGVQAKEYFSMAFPAGEEEKWWMVALPHWLEEEEEEEEKVELLWEVHLRIEEEGNQLLEVVAVGTNLGGKVKSELEEEQW